MCYNTIMVHVLIEENYVETNRFHELFEGISYVAKKKHLDVVLYKTIDEIPKHCRVAILLGASLKWSATHIQRLCERGIHPLIFAMEQSGAPYAYSSITPDYTRAIYGLTKYLLSQDSAATALVGYNEDSQPDRLKYAGFFQAVQEFGVPHTVFENRGDVLACLDNFAANCQDVKNIVSHPQALAQCQKYILENFDENINLIETSSTSASGYYLSDKDKSYCAIVAPHLASELGLNIIDKNIADNKDNKTRFVLVSKTDINLGQKTRTSVVFNTKNESGALLTVLQIFKKHNLNLIYLESRPSKKVFGEYNFFADIDKGIDEVAVALDEIQAVCNFYKFLGSYPTV